MLITKTIAEALIEKNKPFAPNAAKIIAVHEDGRIIFAEKFEQGVKFWYADTMRESTLQGIIHKLTLVAKRNDQGDWVCISDFSKKVIPAAPKSRQDRILESQEKLRAARESKPSSASKVVKNVDVMPVVQLSKGDLKVETEMMSDFISIRDLDPLARRSPELLFISFRPNGKIIMSKALRDKLAWTTINMLVSRNFKRFAVSQGDQYNVNRSGTYVNRALCSKLSFPEDSGTVRAVLEWDNNLNMFVGEFQ